MATETTKYFSGTTQVSAIQSMRNDAYRAAFPGVKGKRFDGFAMLVGRVDGSRDFLPVTRTIAYKRNPSLHKCDARCRNAKGGSCECSCGGQFHGAGNA